MARKSRKQIAEQTKVGGYVRVSNERQVDQGGQPIAQDEKMRQYCSLYDLTLVGIVIDAGISAQTLQREGLQEALCMLISGQVDGIGVVKLDKLTRNVSDRGSLIQNYFNTYALMSVSEQVNTRPASGR
jgi:site-specific DNA recombinase